MKKRLLLVICLLAVASLMAAMAYNSATVNSSQTLKVVNTDQALLALKPGTGTGNQDGTAYVDGDGVLKVDFGTSGISKNGFPGLQPNSSYQWDKLISVWNKSAEPVEVTVTVTGKAGKFLTINGYDSGSNWFDGIDIFEKGISYTFTLGADSTIPMTFLLELPRKVAHGTFNGKITISAEVPTP